MKLETRRKDSFSVIGKEGSTEDGANFIQTLWNDANQHFPEITALAKKDSNGNFVGFWGAMTDFSRSYQPWEEGFSKGLYLAGVEVEDDAVAPAGWTKWTMPASEYLVVKVTGPETFSQVIQYMKENQIELAGAVYDYNDPSENGQGYMYFPTKRL